MAVSPGFDDDDLGDGLSARVDGAAPADEAGEAGTGADAPDVADGTAGEPGPDERAAVEPGDCVGVAADDGAVEAVAPDAEPAGAADDDAPAHPAAVVAIATARQSPTATRIGPLSARRHLRPVACVGPYSTSGLRNSVEVVFTANPTLS
jgi:hypothetical protein